MERLYNLYRRCLMDRLNEYQQIIQEVLTEYAAIPY